MYIYIYIIPQYPTLIVKARTLISTKAALPKQETASPVLPKAAIPPPRGGSAAAGPQKARKPFPTKPPATTGLTLGCLGLETLHENLFRLSGVKPVTSIFLSSRFWIRPAPPPPPTHQTHRPAYLLRPSSRTTLILSTQTSTLVAQKSTKYFGTVLVAKLNGSKAYAPLTPFMPLGSCPSVSVQIKALNPNPKP